jgi:DNA (cytosine-5)-methyltransferase 1
MWDTPLMVPRHGIALSLFSGAGGLDLGVERAGFQVAAAVEVDGDAADSLEKNFGGLVTPVLRRDILTVPTRELLRAAGLRGRARPELLVGGPPCTPFSKSGFWLDWKRAGLDPAASLLQAYTRVLAEAKPEAFILENVYALTFNNAQSRPAYERLLREIDAAGYAFKAEPNGSYRVGLGADSGPVAPVGEHSRSQDAVGVLLTDRAPAGSRES